MTTFHKLDPILFIFLHAVKFLWVIISVLETQEDNSRKPKFFAQLGFTFPLQTEIISLAWKYQESMQRGKNHHKLAENGILPNRPLSGPVYLK